MRARGVPTYLRVVATTRCNYRCEYCHMEGDPHAPGTAPELPFEALVACLVTAAKAGVKKFKFLGGEPLVRRDLPAVIAALRAAATDADISLITAGVVPVERLRECYAAGLTRVNVSIHGWRPAALAKNISARDAWALRQCFLEAAVGESVRRGVGIKLNYVWKGDHDRDDLGALLDWAARQPVTVGLLDDLSTNLSWQHLSAALTELRGPHADEVVVDDPHSLPTLVRTWRDGLRVELKHQSLGAVAPFDACSDCDQRSRCKEGILALRLTHLGVLQPCMDRPDLGMPLGDYVATHGTDIGASFFRRVVEAL